MEQLKVLFHVNEVGRWPVALSNIVNFLNDVGGTNATVTVVANGEAVTLFGPREGGQPSHCGASCSLEGGQPDPRDQIADLARQGVTFLLCRNALRAFRVPTEDLPSFVHVVPAGITEMVRRQREGYAYIKP